MYTNLPKDIEKQFWNNNNHKKTQNLDWETYFLEATLTNQS